ncbi:MAG: hypothetical protein RIQ89_1060 [Bacteroidota bacterium]|jgi:gliding motility-associated-like protein
MCIFTWMNKVILLFLFLALGIQSSATHNRAGEITYECLGGLTYRVTITTYTKTSGQSINADRPQLDSVKWGDGTRSTFVRDNFLDLGNDVRRNVYINTHTYPGNGVFTIQMEDPNRNAGVVNIPASVDVVFYIETTLIINAFMPCNSSPKLLYPPIDRGCRGVAFVHNPIAFDVEGDSISYELTECKAAGGTNILGYRNPYATNSYSLNSITGDLIWDTPDTIGEYNVAFLVKEWRNGSLLSVITRDMQIEIGTCTNTPPDISNVNDTCIIAGSQIAFAVCATDAENDNVTLSASGGPFQVSNVATFPTITAPTTACSNFEWSTTCDNIRTQPYQVAFRAVDDNPQVNLVSLKNVFIKVIGPAPQTNAAVALAGNIVLNWTGTTCQQAVTGFQIFRKGGFFTGTFNCPCETGVGGNNNFQLIATVADSIFNYTDNNNGAGLAIGVNYCYAIVAVYNGGALSCPSPIACAKLSKDLPVITNVSVEQTSTSNGKDSIAWSAPTDIDTLNFPPPYSYQLYRADGFSGGNYTFVANFNTLFDTLYLDSGINTFNGPSNYKLEFFYTLNGLATLKGTAQTASSIFLTLVPTDNQINLSWQEVVQWDNLNYEIYRQDNGSGPFVLVGSTNFQTFSDTGLVNGVNYCYYVQSVGTFSSGDGFRDPILNKSQLTCAVPFDNVAPCQPLLTVLPDCIAQTNLLNWQILTAPCNNDISSFNIYYSPGDSNNFEWLLNIPDGSIRSFTHANLISITGCYKLTAMDSMGNESEAALYCIDTCRQYNLPNVFTPNGDGNNDLWHACDTTTDLLYIEKCKPYKNVKSVLLKVYNRWGQIVYSTDKIVVDWDGKERNTGRECPEGVYYYTAEVKFYRLKGDETITLNGFVHLLRGK